MNSANNLANKLLSSDLLNEEQKSLLTEHFKQQDANVLPALNKKLSHLIKKYQSREEGKLSFQFEFVSIESFLKGLKTIDFFKKFSTINFFIHEKGLNSCTKFEYTDLDFKKVFKDISDFNRLFQSIRKSKNKSFGQSTLKGANFEILGTFLAKNFSLSKHNAILIISRDDFLPQTEEDINQFNELCVQLEYYLELLLKYLSLIEKKALIKNIVANLPLSIKVISPDEFSSSKIELKSEHYVVFKNNCAIIFNLSEQNELDHVDLFHKERIKLLGDLLNTLRHEISNPLFGLKLTTELLTTEELNLTQSEFLSEILTSLNRCTSIIEEFTNLYRSDKELKNIAIGQLIQEVLTLTKSETRQILRKVTIDESDKPITVKTNPTWLVQILFNLIVNAAHALKDSNVQKPQIDIVARLEANEVQVLIKDNGPNVPEDKIDVIFKPFFTTKATGTGLGLSISRNLAKKIGGDLEYLQQTGGACFKLTIPHE